MNNQDKPAFISEFMQKIFFGIRLKPYLHKAWAWLLTIDTKHFTSIAAKIKKSKKQVGPKSIPSGSWTGVSRPLYNNCALRPQSFSSLLQIWY